MECCICLNNLTNDNLFFLECCKQTIHHTCLIQWINTNIDNPLPDFNKCILCKSYNSLIDDSYKNMLYYRNHSITLSSDDNVSTDNVSTNNVSTNNVSTNNVSTNNNDMSNNHHVIFINPYIRLDIHNRIVLYNLFKGVLVFSTITGVVTYFLWGITS